MAALTSLFVFLIGFVAISHASLDCLCPSNSTGQPSCFSSNSTCDQAVQVWEYALKMYTLCYSGSTPSACSPLCEIFDEYFNQPSPPAADLFQWFNSTFDWANFNTQAVLSSAVWQAADIGEMINRQWATAEATNDDVYSIWLGNWISLANRVITSADHSESLGNYESAISGYLRASSYYFLSQYPAPYFDNGIYSALDAAQNISLAFQHALQLMTKTRGLYVEYFNVSLSMNGYNNVALPIVFATTNPDTALPLMFLTAGTEYPKEQMVLQVGFASLARGYAIVAYEGPGQGEVVRGPSHMPFQPEWEVVGQTVLDGLRTHNTINKMIDFERVIAVGSSLGGFLTGRICAGLTTQIAACVVNPAAYSMGEFYNNGLFGGILGPLIAAAQSHPGLLPSGYAPLLQSAQTASDTIGVPLMLECGDEGKELLQATFSEILTEVVIPDTAYLAFGYAGTVTSNITQLVDHVLDGLIAVQSFVNDNISNITAPTLVLQGTEDNIEPGQGLYFFESLNPDTQSQSMLVNFTAQTGGALHCEVGAQTLLDTELFNWLLEMLGSFAT